ncbi:MAG: ribulose-phosphate 3-epimerase [Deltaproteobacteria bacterium]|nr:ribulose-phosphate 3-epimerase [Deltaproteobacteria bacterium]
MPRQYKIAPSILSADFSRLGEEVRSIEQAGADLIHFDVMDGHFVPNLSFGIPVLEAVRKITSLPLDVHLMIENPQRYLEPFVQAGANSISVHAEVCENIPAIADRMHQLGIHAAIAINPETEPARVLAAAAALDMILVMSVHPGFGGQGFIPESVSKLATVRRELRRQGLEIEVEVDGGIKVENIGLVARAGANVFVSGSGIFGHRDYGEIIYRMRSELLAAGQFKDSA